MYPFFVTQIYCIIIIMAIIIIIINLHIIIFKHFNVSFEGILNKNAKKLISVQSK